MTNRNTIQNELMDLGSTLANYSPQSIYAVPDGYFEGLANQVMDRIRAFETDPNKELEILSPLLTQLVKKTPYAAPAGYFDGLEEKMMQVIREHADYQTSKEEIASLSPLLSSIQKRAPYSIPDGYFESIRSTGPEQKTKESSKVITISSRKWFRYAAAAIVIGFIAIAGFTFFSKTSNNEGTKAIARFEKDVKKMDNEETTSLIQFIDAGMSGEEVASTPGKRNDDVRELLKGVPENELNEFLEQTEDTEDVLLVN